MGSCRAVAGDMGRWYLLGLRSRGRPALLSRRLFCPAMVASGNERPTGSGNAVRLVVLRDGRSDRGLPVPPKPITLLVI